MTLRGDIGLGGRYLLAAFGRLNRPGIRRFVFGPLLLNAVLLSVFGVWFFGVADDGLARIATWLPSWLSWLYWLLLPLLLLLMMLLLMYVFSTVLMLIGSPFNGLLAEQVEREQGAEFPAESMTHLLVRTFARELRKWRYFLPRYLILAILMLIPGVNLLSPLLWFVFTSWVLALQYVDYSYDNHGDDFLETRKALASQPLTAIGFGAVVSGLMLIPIVNWFVMPSAVIAATQLRVACFPPSCKHAEIDYADN